MARLCFARRVGIRAGGRLTRGFRDDDATPPTRCRSDALRVLPVRAEQRERSDHRGLGGAPHPHARGICVADADPRARQRPSRATCRASTDSAYVVAVSGILKREQGSGGEVSLTRTTWAGESVSIPRAALESVELRSLDARKTGFVTAVGTVLAIVAVKIVTHAIGSSDRHRWRDGDIALAADARHPEERSDEGSLSIQGFTALAESDPSVADRFAPAPSG